MLKQTRIYADLTPMTNLETIEGLRQALLDIEWASRRSAGTPALDRIGNISRSAIRALPQQHSRRDLTRLGHGDTAGQSAA